MADNKKTISEMVEIMKHFDQGGKVERLARNYPGLGWSLEYLPSWDWSGSDYRIYQEPKKKVTYWRPWYKSSNGELFCNYMFHKDKNHFNHYSFTSATFHHFESMEIEE